MDPSNFVLRFRTARARCDRNDGLCARPDTDSDAVSPLGSAELPGVRCPGRLLDIALAASFPPGSLALPLE